MSEDDPKPPEDRPPLPALFLFNPDAPYRPPLSPDSPFELEPLPYPEVPSDHTFCPDHDDCFLAFLALLPRGTAWDNTVLSMDRGSVIRQFMSALALSWVKFEDAMCISLDEWICSTSDEDIDMWARDYGVPDECDLYNQNICAKVAANGAPTADYLRNLMTQSGYLGEVRWLAGDDVDYPGIYSTLYVIIDKENSPAFAHSTLLSFKLGEKRALGSANTEAVECMLERYVPAHCGVYLTFVGGPPRSGLLLETGDRILLQHGTGVLLKEGLD